jgi:hypothetical protein
MKYFKLLAFIVVTAFLFSSCKTQVTVEKRKYLPGYHINWIKNEMAVKSETLEESNCSKRNSKLNTLSNYDTINSVDYEYLASIDDNNLLAANDDEIPLFFKEESAEHLILNSFDESIDIKAVNDTIPDEEDIRRLIPFAPFSLGLSTVSAGLVALFPVVVAGDTFGLITALAFIYTAAAIGAGIGLGIAGYFVARRKSYKYKGKNLSLFGSIIGIISAIVFFILLTSL